MFNVVTMVNKKIVKNVSFNEKKDDDAMKKALVECDRAIWDNQDADNNFVVALMQDGRVLRFMNDSGWQAPRRSIYE